MDTGERVQSKEGAYYYYIDTIIGQVATLTFRWDVVHMEIIMHS